MAKVDKRKGRRTIRERRAVQTSVITMPLDDAVTLARNVKLAKNLKPRTIKDFDIHMRDFMQWLNDNYGDLSADEITSDMIRQYVLWLKNEKEVYAGHPFKSRKDKKKYGLSAATVNIRLRVLKSFFNILIDEKVITDNPTSNVNLMRVEQDTVKPLTDDEVRRLLEAPDQRYFSQFRDYVIMFLIIDTGMRLNEICSLELQNVDLKSRQIILPASKNKNRKPRILPLSSESIKLLMELINESCEYFDSNHVFNTYYGEPVNEKTIQKALPKYAKKAGIERQVSPHILRHNFAKMAAMNGMDIFTIQRILGHQEITTTRKYVQLDDDDIKMQHNQFSPVKRILKRRS